MLTTHDKGAPALGEAAFALGARTKSWLRGAKLPRLRALVQLAYVLFFAAVGIEFFLFVQQSMRVDPVTAHRSPTVEAFLPISALLGLRQWFATGQWDEVHPAGLAILLAAGVASLLARKAFCSWICPVGAVSRFVAWVGAKTVWARDRRATLVPWWLDKLLALPKYALLAFFLWTVFGAMPLGGVIRFLHSPYNRAADAKMLLFFAEPTLTVVVVMGVLVVASLVVKNLWCRYLCPYGALLGLLSLLSPLHIARDETRCTQCKACTRACPVEIPVHRRLRVINAACTGCLDCVARCPQHDCLTVAVPGRRSLRTGWVPVLALGAVLSIWAAARSTGHWQTAMTVQDLAAAYREARLVGHP